MNELQKLYDVLVREGKYTKSFDDFQQKWSQEEAYRDKVYGVVSRDGLYTKDKDSFLQKYSASAEAPVASTVKKKEPTQQAGALGAMPSPLRSSADDGSFGGSLSQVGQKAQGMQRKPVLPLRPIEDRIQEEAAKIGSFNQTLNQRKAQLAEMQASMGAAPTQEQAQTYNKIAGEFNSELVKANEEQKRYNNLIDEYSSQSNSPTFAGNFQNLMKDTQRYEMPIPAPKEVGTWENIWNNLANGNDTAWRSLGTFVARGSGAALGMGAMDAMGTMADLALSKYYPANRAVKGSEEMNMAEAAVASFAQSAPIMVASMATGTGGAALAGRAGMRALGSIPMFVTGFEQGIKGADEAGVTGLDKYNYATLNGAFEAISEMILPDAQLIKPLKDKLFKDIIRQGAKGLSKKDVARYTADFAAKGGLEFGEELFVDLTSMLTDYAYGSALGIEELTPEMKSAREYGIMAMSSMIGAGIFSTVSSANDALSAKKSAIVAASDNVGLANQTTMQLLEEGVLTEVQAAEFMASVEAVAAVRGRIPSMVGADAIVDTAPLIEQKTAIDAQIADLEIQKAQADDAYQPMLQQQIDALKGQREQLNEQIQTVITPQAESAAVELEMPSIERILEDLDNGKVVTFQYEKESDIPIEFRDKVSSFGEVNGKKNFNVTMAESLANYYLSKQNAQQPTTQQEAATPQAQQQVTEAGEVASPVAEQAGAVVEGVQEGGVDTRIANSPLAEVVNKRGVITDANGNLVEGDVYVDGERVVLEAGGRIYDTLGSIDELSQMTAEQLPVQVVAPRITATEGGFTYNSSEGVMPQGTRVTPQGTGLKAVKRDKNGNVKSVVVKDDAGNTFNLKGEDAQAMAFELMMDEISKGNLDAKIVLNDEAATAINTAGRPATTQAADSGATQADATRQGAATPTTATERGDGGRVDVILNDKIDVTDSRGRKGIAKISDVERFIGEDRTGKAEMPTSRATIDKLKADILKNGFKEPIVVVYDKFSGNGEASIVEGNHRIVAAKELGFEEVPIIIEKGTIRTDEARIKDNMFPLNRVEVGKINDTFGVSSNQLGFEVRQPNENDFKKTKPDAAKKPSTEGVDARKQAEDGEGVGKEDSKRKEATQETQPQSKAKDIEQQVADFGTQEADVKPVSSVISRVFDTLKQAGLTSAKTVGDWIGIGRGSEKPYSLKINGEDVNVKSVQPEVIAGFYSPLEKVISETKLDKLPAKQWVDKFAKGEEAKFTGLTDWLSQQQGSVSKADIQDYLKNNRVEIVEVVKGKDTTKFSQYQLEGEKENYKEVLVLLPTLEGNKQAEYDNYYKSLIAKYGESGRLRHKISEEEKQKLDSLRPSKGLTFKSSHYDEPNILVHLRMNTRTAADGSKVLFLEELQSDWGQQGKREGFAKSAEETKVEYDKADKAYDDYLSEIEGKYGKNFVIEDLSKSDYDKYANLANSRANLGLQLDSNRPSGVPTAPFVTDTNAWTKLGLKAALKEAVAQGVDKIAWTTGEQQNERYDLSKQVDEITYRKNDDGNYYVSATKDGSKVFTETNVAENKLESFFGKDVAQRIINSEGDKGQANSKILKGEQLSVGGKGMKGFYGSPTEGNLGIVGNVAKSLFKQEPGTVEIGTTTDEGTLITIRDTAGIKEYSKKGYEFMKGHRVISKQDAYAIIEEGGEVKAVSVPKSTQYSIDITPELKASVEQGQPLFKDAEAQYHIQSGKNVIEAINNFNKAKNKSRATVALTHEIMHPTVVAIIDGAKDGNNVGAKHTQTIIDEFNKANPKNKITVEQLIEGNDAFKNGSTSEQYRAVQEFIAESWEQYNLEGKQGFSKAFQDVLDQITKAFQAVYKAVSGKELTPELRQMFDEILGKPKGKEAAQEGEVADKPRTSKEGLARDRKKAAIDVLKKQWENAKNTGISTNFEQRLKDDKAFFGAIRDIIQSNIEIGALKITDSLNDIADALGIKLSKADKDAVKGVFNKEVLRSLKSAQAEMFETEVVREALGEYIEENKQVLKGAANAQALKLVNEASTEGGFNRALKYIDKLINNTEFREAVAAATDATKPSNVRPALTKLSVARSIIDFFAGLKVTALEDVSLMQRLATILKAPDSVNIREITQLAEDVQKYLSEKQKDALPTQSEVEKSVEGLLVRREKDADGNMQSVSKEFDTARKISNLAKKIAEVEANIYRLGLEPDAQEAMLKSLDAAKRLVETKQSDLVEAIESFRASNIASAKETITKIAKNVIAVSERAKEALGLNAISQRLSELDSLSFYESERLINGLEQIANGYTPLGFFKAVATPIINKPQVQAATLLQNQATALQKKIAKEFADNGGIIGSVRKIFDRIRFGKEAVTGGVKQADVRKITGNMAIAGLVNIDQMYKMAIKSPVLKGFWLPLRKAMVTYRLDLTQTIRRFEKEAGAGIWTRVKGNTALLADSQIKSNIKVGAALAQASENAYRNKFNILQEQNNFFKNKADQETGASRIHIESVSQLAKQYPNGVTYKDLTPREKKVYDAFRNLVDNNLEAKQNMANISAGTPFEALQNYFPFIPSTNVKMFEQVGTKETDSAIKGLIAAKGDATKKAKIKSDRGLQRNMDADFYPIELDVFSAARISAAQTLKQYHLEPTLYTAKRAINQVASETGGAVSAALSDMYEAEVVTQLSSNRNILARAASGILNLETAQKLSSLKRIPNEILSGAFGFTYVTGKYTRDSITFSPAVTEKLNEEFGASLLQAKGIKNVTDTAQKAKDLVERLRSPDALNEGFWGNAAFAYSLRQKFKEATGKELEYSKLLDDDYIEANRKDIQAAYDDAIIGNVLYDNSNVGQALAVKLPYFGAILRKDKSEAHRVANQYAMSFGRYAAKIGNNLSATISAKRLPDTEFSDPVTNKEVARKLMSTITQGVVYQYAADAAIMATKYGWTALKEGLSDDDEEQKELEEARARLWDEYLLETLNPERVALTATGSLMYFALGMYGSFGKAMIYFSAWGASKALDWMYENDKTITKAEVDSNKKLLNNVLVSTTYMQTPRNEKEFEANLLLVASGGGKFVVSETINIGSSMADFFTDVASGDVDATNALYSIGIIYNATYGRKMQMPIPYLEDIGKASRSVAEVTETSSPEDISKAFKKDKQKADRLINTYAQRTFIDETKGNSNALEENEELLRKALKAAGFAEDDINDKAELFEDRYNRSKMPLYLYKIINEKSPQASAGMAAENFISFANDLEKATKKGDAEKIRIAEEQILVLRSTLRDKKMPRKGAKGDDRRAFLVEFEKKLSESGIEY